MDMLVCQSTPFGKSRLRFCLLHMVVDLGQDSIRLRGKTDTERGKSTGATVGYATLQSKLDEERVLGMISCGEDLSHVGSNTSGGILD